MERVLLRVTRDPLGNGKVRQQGPEPEQSRAQLGH